jgi:hypothetical protein
MLLNVRVRVLSKLFDPLMNVRSFFEIEHDLADPPPLSFGSGCIIEYQVSVRVMS